MSELLLRPRTVLVPLLNLGVAPQLVHLAAALIAGPNKEPAPGARIIVAGVVEVPPGQPLSDGRNMARSYRAMFGFLPPSAALRPTTPGATDVHLPPGEPAVPVHHIVKVAHSIARGIREAALEDNADLLLLHWKGHPSDRRSHTFGEIIDELLDDPPCNCLLFRPGAMDRIESILVAVRGGPSAELALGASAALAAGNGAAITLFHGVPAHVLERQPAIALAAHAPAGLGHKHDAAQSDRLRGDEPYLDLAARAATLATKLGITIAPALTASPEVADELVSAAESHDLVVLGAPQRTRGNGDSTQALRGLVAQRNKPLLLARAPGEFHLQDYQRRVSRATPNDEISAEHWFVENTYHADESASLDNWLEIKNSRGSYLSVVLPTHNDAQRIFTLLTALRKALQEHAPIADEILVVDAASTDDTCRIVAELGFPVLPIKAKLRGVPEPADLLRGALNLARGNVIVWLDPKAGRLHPGLITALTPPLLSDPGVRLVKPFWSALGGAEAADDGAEEDAVARFSQLRPADLLPMKADDLALLPLHALFRAFFPLLGAVVDPASRVFAARPALLNELLPVLVDQQERLAGSGATPNRLAASVGFYAGLLLETATRYGARTIAQVEMPRRRGKRQATRLASSDLRHLRQIAELLELFTLHRDKIADPDSLERLRRSVNTAIT